MSIACILGGTGERRTKTHACHDQSPTSVPMDGNATAEAFITRQWLPDFPNTPAHCGTGRTLADKPLFNETTRYRRGAVGCSWLFHRVHSATMARLSWPAGLPPKSVKISIRHGFQPSGCLSGNRLLTSGQEWSDQVEFPELQRPT